ncbi:hypothetical protein EII34_06745 [Arachnia propionica]|uniref:Uncharacterized protein n=1 Tax=Arachnia propionica TaxID=1750 RepID=A0A3P1TAD6_9ACTN|nr:hypothetical protein [Arachnia propionica]MDO5083792.1 hypothetical protein [Arachnia propionica]RRD05423.1 hypothetical protein EII34_06745 [Arachnia propionica]
MAGRHAADSSRERTLALTILGVGSLIVVLSLFGGVWLVRAGAILAVGMAFAAVFVAWSELRRERAEHQTEVRRQIALRKEQAQKHHADSVEMIERFNGRAEKLQQVIESLRRQLGAANSELSSMRGNAVWLRSEVAERQARIDALQTRITELEAELEESIAEATENVVELPRPAQAPAEDLWGEDEDPTMVDLGRMSAIVRKEQLRKQA